MKKVLSLVSSAALALAVALPTPAAAQTAKKLAGARNGRAVEQTATTAKSQPKGLYVAKTRSHVAGSPSLAKAMQATSLKRGDGPARAAAEANLPDLRGSVVYNDLIGAKQANPGLYKILNGSTELMFEGPQAGYGGVEVDGVYYTTNYESFFGMIFVDINAYDVETGQKLGTISGDIDNITAGGVTVDPSTGNVYGITYNANGDGMQLAKLEYTTESVTTTAIAPISGNWNTLACDGNGQLYGISFDGVSSGDSFTVTSSTLNKIDKTTGAVTVIGDTGQVPLYLSSGAIDPKSGRMFWNVCPPDETGSLYEVNLTTGAATKLFQFANNDEIMGMYVALPAAEDKAPAVPMNLAVNFPKGALSGTVEFKAPTTLFDGSAATGSLTYEILVNGEAKASGSTSFGATVSAPLTVAEAGDYTFVVTVSNSVGKSPKAKTTAYLGHGTPAKTTATLEYTGGKMKLTWTPVTTTVEGGYIDASAVTYTVTRYPGAAVVAENTSATSFEEAIAAPEEITQYYYTVVAHGAGISSAAAQSNVVTLGSILPPYSNDFSTSGSLDGFTLIDGNNDGKVWTIDNGRARMSYNSSLDMDDWMITPPLQLEAGKAYLVSFKAASNGTSYPERLEVKWGKAATAAAMTGVILQPTVLNSAQDREFSEYITPDADGTYYIGFHGISDADQFYLFVDDLSVSAGVSATAPGAATDLKAVPDYNGDYKATVSFKAPTVDFSGAALASLTKVELSRDGNVIKTWDAPATGAALSYEDTMTKGGDVTYAVTAYNASGAGKTATVSAYIGVGKPAAPTNIKVTENAAKPGELTVTWDAVTTDEDGNPINPALVEYIVAIYDDAAGGWVEASTEELTATTYTFQAVPAGEQDFVQIAVFAGTEGGEAGAAYNDLIACGTPYDGLQESFPGGSLNYIWGTGYSEAEGAWGVYTDDQLGIASQDADNGYAAMKGTYLDSSSALYTGKVSLAGAVNPGVSFYTYTIIGEDGDPDINEFQLYVKEPADADWTKLGAPIVVSELGQEEGWHLATASLAAYAGKTIQVRFQATTKQYVFTLLDNIKIGSMLGDDLVARAINAPATVKAGDDYTVDVTVGNAGTKDAGEFTVELYADGELAATENVAALASGANKTVTFERTMSAVAEVPVDYYAVVKYTADENTADNTTETVSVAPKQSKLPKVTDLKAEDTPAGVKLTWTEPDLTSAPAEPTLTDFEDGQAWAMEYEGWTFVDLDLSPIGGFRDLDVPGITPNETTASFFVFDAAGDEFNQTFEAHSGTKYLAAFFRYDDGTVDDWAISPALDGSAQTISFWARSYSSQYPDKFEAYYSTGSLDPMDFVKVKDATVAPANWTEYTFDVPAGAKHFAIRSCATGSFVMMLDDFTFTPASATADLTLVGYDVYRDGVKITTEPTGETEFTDTNATEGEHTYVVVTVYESGTSAPSNTATVTATGIDDALAGSVAITAGKGTITVTGAEGMHVAVTAIDGKLIYSAAGAARTSVNVVAGVYVVKAGNTIAKVAVK